MLSGATDARYDQYSFSGWREIVVDCSDNILAERHMTNRESWLDAMLSASDESVLLLDATARVLMVSPGAAARFGCERKALEGRRATDLGLDQGTTARLHALVRQVVASGEPAVAAGLTDGLELRLAPARDPDGTVGAVSVRMTGGDTARHAAVRRFMATARHDVRQPFQAMHLFHHLLAGRLDDPASNDLADRLGEAIQASETFVRTLLDIMSLDAGVVTAEPATVDLDEVLARLLDGFMPKADARRLRLQVRPTGARVESDPVQLERLLSPLIANALHFTKRGGVLIGGRWRGDSLRLEIWDTGHGIPAAELGTIFDDFHRFAPPGQESQPGHGLGLGLVRRLSRLLGHPVSLRSRPGHGSVATVTLPLAEPAGRTRRADKAQAKEAADAAGNNGTILVIEDDAIQLAGMDMLLRCWGYGVVPTRSLTEADMWLTADGVEPDLVISDLQLAGGESGLDAIRAVHARCRRAVPSVVVTGTTDPERLRAIHHSGFRLLHKPCDPGVLRQLIARALGREPATA
jgi:signal transduction histidine kinase/ActR/RegA family two-component response regulator